MLKGWFTPCTMQPDHIKQHLQDHHQEYYGWALHCCGTDKHMVPDVLQTAYLKIMEKQTSFREQSAFMTWAFAIIRNTALDAARKGRKERSRITGDRHLMEEVYPSKAGDATDDRLKEQFFAEAMRLLTERQREIMQLVFYHDLSLKETGQVLNISTGAVSRQYDRAKKRLVGWLHQKGITIKNYNGLI
jgi:RNA polymerase sigma-70 factor (ECF subfamily)